LGGRCFSKKKLVLEAILISFSKGGDRRLICNIWVTKKTFTIRFQSKKNSTL